MGVQRVEESGPGWTLALNDCVIETRDHMADSSVDLIVTSIPFSNHYEYTPSYNDFGHTDNNLHFWQQMDYLTPELLRVLRPGRIYACHVKDRIQFGNVTGAGIPTVSPFHAEALAHGLKHGFDYMGMITVTTDVVRENNQTYRLGYTEMRKDGTKMGVGSPEYILLFHKPQSDRSKGYADDRVSKDVADYSLARWQIDAAADWRSSGNRLLAPEELAAIEPKYRSRLFKDQTRANVYDFDAHVSTGEALAAKNALPSTFKSLDPGSWRHDVWDDVNRMLTLNGEQSRRALEFHICPLQFDIVDRLIERYSNKGDLVFDPFGGLGTVPLRARKLGREGRASELNPTSFRDAVMYQRELDAEQATPSLFDLLDLEEGTAA
jgi:DNA modification methylase